MKKVISLLVIVLAVASTHAKEGGNGGGAHFCPNSIELYDFFEGSNPLLHKINIWVPDISISKEKYLELALANVRRDQPLLYPALRKEVDNILAIPENELVLPIEIPRVNDADIPFVKNGCEYIQVGNWNTRFGRLFFSETYYKAMNSMNQAGLILHEAVYYLARTYGGATNSDNVRKFVAQSFSDETVDTSVVSGITSVYSNGICEVKLEVITNNQNLGYNLSLSIGKESIEVNSPNSVKNFQLSCESIFQNNLWVSWNFQGGNTKRVDGITYNIYINNTVGASVSYGRKDIERALQSTGGKNSGSKRIKVNKFGDE